ncbi:MAG: Hsp20/alpha crystallin family protein [bacterium]|nr:Hsp20/alpha crystallin family protein [bacterium]
MNLIPTREIFNMHKNFNTLLHDAFYGDHGETAHTDWAQSTEFPVTDVYETQDEYVFRLETPGIAKDNIKIEFHDGTLSIKGERKAEEVNEDNYSRFESFSGNFSRSFTLPGTIDSQKMDAAMKDGILTLKVAKAEEVKPRTIPIQ